MNIPFPVITLVGDRWIVLEDWTISIWGASITVPEGFRTDFATIPRVLFPIRTSTELSLEGPLLHDYLYANGGWTDTMAFTRAEADRMFYEIMRHKGVSLRHAWTAWAAVRLVGWRYWKEVNRA